MIIRNISTDVYLSRVSTLQDVHLLVDVPLVRPDGFSEWELFGSQFVLELDRAVVADVEVDGAEADGPLDSAPSHLRPRRDCLQALLAWRLFSTIFRTVKVELLVHISKADCLLRHRDLVATHCVPQQAFMTRLYESRAEHIFFGQCLLTERLGSEIEAATVTCTIRAEHLLRQLSLERLLIDVLRVKGSSGHRLVV